MRAFLQRLFATADLVLPGLRHLVQQPIEGPLHFRIVGGQGLAGIVRKGVQHRPKIAHRIDRAYVCCSAAAHDVWFLKGRFQ